MNVPRLHVVTDDATLESPSFVRSAIRVLEAGGGDVALHVRGPRASGRKVHDSALALAAPARSMGAWLLVNDRVDVALTAGAHGVHLGARSMSPRDARYVLGPGRVVGLSTHGAAAVAEAVGGEGGGPEGLEVPVDVTYVFIGNVFATPSHPDRRPGGRVMVEAALEVARGTPVLAIGGVTADRVGEVLAWGSHGVAVLRGVWGAPDPAAAVERYRIALTVAGPVESGAVERSGGVT